APRVLPPDGDPRVIPAQWRARRPWAALEETLRQASRLVFDGSSLSGAFSISGGSRGEGASPALGSSVRWTACNGVSLSPRSQGPARRHPQPPSKGSRNRWGD